MYLFAHRVRSPKGQRGINAARYSHADGALPDSVWVRPAREVLALITQQENGHRIAESIGIALGGNGVEAFLDVVGPDETSMEALVHALATARTAIVGRRPPAVRAGLVTMEFSVNLGEADVFATFDELAGAVLGLYAAPPVLRAEPVDIEVGRSPDGWTFRVADASVHRVRDAGGSPLRAGIRRDVADDFRKVHGHLYPYAAQWVTGLSSEQLLALGGARFLHEGKPVGKWPAGG
jgi:hypothetical protein